MVGTSHAPSHLSSYPTRPGHHAAAPAPPRKIGVVIAPGEMQLTRTPCEISSVAHTLVTWIMAAFQAQ